jgi:hypothetical protein
MNRPNLPLWRWTVTYLEGPPREVTAYSRAGALRCARRPALLVGCKGKEARPVSAVPRWEVGTPRHPDLFGPLPPPPEDTPEDLTERR